MTHIEQMIQDMCPNGVEFKTLGEVCEMKRGSTITANQAEDGDIPVIAGGQKPAYFHNQSNREGKNITVAGSGAYAGYVAYWEQPIFVSDAFTVVEGDSKPVSISLGKPKNAEFVVTFAESFTTLYENYSVTIGNNTLQANGSLYAMPGATVSYTIKGTAKQGSHVSDLPANGITGSISAEAGTSYPLNITASSISDLLIQIGEGTHNGEFDTREFRPLN